MRFGRNVCICDLGYAVTATVFIMLRILRVVPYFIVEALAKAQEINIGNVEVSGWGRTPGCTGAQVEYILGKYLYVYTVIASWHRVQINPGVNDIGRLTYKPFTFRHFYHFHLVAFLKQQFLFNDPLTGIIMDLVSKSLDFIDVMTEIFCYRISKRAKHDDVNFTDNFAFISVIFMLNGLFGRLK